MKCLVVIPTYNEKENIVELIKKILSVRKITDILVIDDNSPDGTGEIVEKISKTNKRVNCIRRSGKMGLGSAYVTGFKYALKKNYDYVFEMDADFSHNPEMIPLFLDRMRLYDVVIGSRYYKGISVINWSLRRLALSLLASFYVRIILGLPLNDNTAGYKCFSAKVLRSIDLDKVKSDGYSFQIEMNYKAFRNGFRLGELPIVFVDRHSGTSKMDGKIIMEALLIPWRLRIEYLFKGKAR
jgi:dolichol-phosphate mannosyltransferase